ncbi:MAG: long-chain-fatty-acid--CoA ligase [Alphaproteobacteria bacterium]|nr:long-chain-fatty-acid--CoA ligase [Alphaproteobacteria bacterium]
MHLTQGLHRAVQTRGRETATIFGDRRRTWSELRDRVARLAAALVARGLKPGDRVGVISLNSDRFVEAYFATWWAGGVIMPSNTRWAVPEHNYALADSGTTILLLDRNFAKLLPELAAANEFRAVILLDDGEAPPGTESVDAIIASSQPMPDTCGNGNELAGLFYTGGTTGRSKGVMLSHDSLISNFLCASGMLPYSSEPIFLHSPPMFHLADAAAVIGVTMRAGQHVVIPFFSPENVVKAIERHRCTDAVFVPTMFAMLRDYLAAHPADLTSMRHIRYGASPISETLLRDAMAMFPNAEFAQAYGQTELSPAATALEWRFHKERNGKSYLRSAGRAIFGIDVRIVDEEMRECPTGTVGEIAVRSPGNMLGYWNQPELTERTIVDGWVRTGDAGYMDEEGFVYLVDRVKDMIVSGGENVYSAEVENALASHPAVAECAVIGVPDDKWGERVHAIVRLKADARASETELIDHCKRAIAGYKCPRSVELRAEPLPLSGAGKILKTDLRAPYWVGHSRRVN